MRVVIKVDIDSGNEPTEVTAEAMLDIVEKVLVTDLLAAFRSGFGDEAVRLASLEVPGLARRSRDD